MSEWEHYASRCPVCDSPLELDEERGYSCPRCGWDESTGLDEDEVWIIPDELDDEDSPD